MRWRLEAALGRRLPFALRRPLRRLLYLPEDVADVVLRRRPPLVPPRGLRDVGAGDFVAVGEEFLGYLRKLGLTPESRVLDAGCGIGRLAVPLTAFLSERGSYDGFDVAAADVRWCGRKIGRRFPNFRFVHADVRNGRYNPNGRIRPEEYVFPFPAGSFDFVVATSLFTHLLEGAARRYLGEIARVLAPGGRSLVTFFLLDEEGRAAISGGRADFTFQVAAGEAHVHDAAEPEAAVAYERSWIERLHRETGLEIEGPAWRGSWTHLPGSVTYQDVVVARKRS
jgi:SAM-dependent methyltransferase